MSPELKALQAVLKHLHDLKIEYMITGSVALQFYATPRMTRDIDFVVQITDGDVTTLIQAFEKDFYVDRQAVEEALLHKSLFNLIHNETVVKIDFIIRKDSPYRKCEFERRRNIPIAGGTAWIVSPEDLILSKLDWAKDSFSEFQIRDVESLFKMGQNLDLKYLSQWVETLGLQDVLNKVRR